MTGKPTPGDWYVGAKPYQHDLVFGTDPVDGSPQTVATVYGYTKEEQEANSHLISAAKNLLEACEAALEFLPLVHDDGSCDGGSPDCRCRACRTIALVEAAIAKARGEIADVTD